MTSLNQINFYSKVGSSDQQTPSGEKHRLKSINNSRPGSSTGYNAGRNGVSAIYCETEED
jgi:hypothetical protein